MRRAAGMLLVFMTGCVIPPVRQASDTTVQVVRGAEPMPALVEVDHLGRAAELLEKGETAAAVPHLTAHVKAYPDAVMIRAYLAESHFKLGELAKARPHFVRFVRDAAGMKGPIGQHLTHCHTRLMEIAAAENDAFGEQLHRGIGLVLLVRQWDADPEVEDADLTESTLLRAAASLKQARQLHPKDARVYLYLSEIWSRLGQHSAARSALRQGRDLLPDVGLNPEERRRFGESD